VYNIWVAKMLFEKEFAMTGYRTMIFFGLALVVAVAGLFGFAGYEGLPAEWQNWYNVLLPLFAMIFRYVTKTPIFKK